MFENYEKFLEKFDGHLKKLLKTKKIIYIAKEDVHCVVNREITRFLNSNFHI